MSDPLEFEARAAGIPPLLEGFEPEARHVVQEHERTIVPKVKPLDRESMIEGIDWPEPMPPQPRKVPVRRHVRRNPRPKKEIEMTLEHEDRTAAHALATEREESLADRLPASAELLEWVRKSRAAGHPERCPDDGTCHHECRQAACFRVTAASPLMASGWDDWPGIIKLAAVNDALVYDPADLILTSIEEDAQGIVATFEGLFPDDPRSALFPIVPGDVAHARSTDPTTSHLAAAEIVTKPSQIAVLRAFRSGWNRRVAPALPGLADFELEHLMVSTGFSPSRIRSARSELQAAGYIRPTGGRRKTPYGREADVHELTPAGRTVALPIVTD